MCLSFKTNKLPSSINEAQSFQILPHALIYCFSVIFPAGSTTTVAVRTLLTCLLTCSLTRIKSLIYLVLEKQAANKALLHHIQGEKLLLQTGELKGRTVWVSSRWSRGKRSKVARRYGLQPLIVIKGHIQDPESSTADPVFSQTDYSAVSMQPCQETNPDQYWCWGAGRCHIISWTCTEHNGSSSFNLSTYLFSLLWQSPIIWQWEHRKMYRTVMYFWGISFVGFVN